MATEIIVWVLFSLFVLAGLAGIFIPVFPGMVLILAAAFLHRLILPEYMSWWTVFLVAFITVLDLVLSALGSVAGAKLAGASKGGLGGAAVGLFLGIFFGPLGLVLGPVVGAIVGELAFAKKGLKEASKAGLGTGMGILASTAFRFALALAAVAAMLADCFLIG